MTILRRKGMEILPGSIQYHNPDPSGQALKFTITLTSSLCVFYFCTILLTPPKSSLINKLKKLFGNLILCLQLYQVREDNH